MAYRLYTTNVAKDIIKSNDKLYHILSTHFIKDMWRHVALIFQEDHPRQFIVAYGFEIQKHEAIGWRAGHYFKTLEEAYTKYINYRYITL